MTLQKSKGVLIPIGGNENRKDCQLIMKRMIKETGKANPKICVFTLGADIPDQTAMEYEATFKDLGIDTFSEINFNLHTEADSEENLDKVKNADLVIFSNGSQLKLSSLLGGTHLLARIKKRYRNESDFVVAGIGSGASALANTMIVSYSSNDAMYKGEIELVNGLNLINTVVIDTHFTKRGRYESLVQTVTFNPAMLGIGLNEDTAVVIKNEEIEVIGSGLVTIVDGTSIEYTDLPEIAHGEPITVEGIKMHFLSVGKFFAINKKQMHLSGADTQISL